MTADAPKPFSPGQIGPITLRNRVIRTACFEGMTPAGLPSDQLVEHHRAMATGGVGMTTVAYCSASRDGLTFGDQMVARPEIVPGLKRLTDAVHQHGAKAALQVGHAGYFASPKAAGTRPVGASAMLCLFTMARSRAMNASDRARIADDFARAADLAMQAGFDALELHLGHGYLLSQVLSPFTNRRKDDYGGSLENRLRFPLEVVDRVRRAMGSAGALLAKTNLSDGFRGGLVVAEAAQVVCALQGAGVDAVVLSGGFVSKTPFYMLRGELPVTEMVRNEKDRLRRVGLRLFGRLAVPSHEYHDLFFLEDARRVRRATDLPLVLLGGVRTLAQMESALAEGFEFVSMGRPLIHDADLIAKMERGDLEASPCEPCNKCVAEMEAGGIRCVHPTLGDPAGERT